MGRRRITSLLLACALLLVLIPASLAGTSSSNSESTLRILMLGGNITYWDKLTKRFEQKYPSIKIQTERVPGPNFQTKWNAYIASRSGPDLISIQSGAVFLPYKEALQPLPELKPDLEHYSGTRNFCDDFNCAKAIYGIPYNSQGYVLYYNKELLRKAGLPVRAPRNWSELDRACTKFKTMAITCIALGMKDFGEWQLAWGPLPNQTMTLAQQKGFYTGKTKWTDPEVVNWIKVYAEMVKRGWFNKDAPAISQTPDAEGMFTSGKAGFIVGFVADIEDYATMGPAIGVQNLGAAAFPAIEKGKPIPGVGPGPLAHIAGISPATAFGLSAWSDKKREALLWIRFVGSKENQQAYLEQVGVPARLGLNTKRIKQPALVDIENLIEHGNGSLAVWYMGFKTQNALKDQMQKFFSGQTTPEQAATAIQEAQEAP
jgi:ABC-type glycerol-3-phosphate transport system substrate-binding protein